MTDFQDKMFFIPPPKSSNNEKAWIKWLEEDKKARAQAKREYTKAQEHGDPRELYAASEGTTKGAGGVYRQGSIVGFVGDGGDNTVQIEVAVDEGSTKAAILSGWAENKPKRGSKGGASRKGRSAKRRAAKRKTRNKK